MWNIVIQHLQIWRWNLGYSEHIYRTHNLELYTKFFIREWVVLYIHYPMHLLFEQRDNLTFTIALNKTVGNITTGTVKYLELLGPFTQRT
jgi:hypothetical protein